MYSQCLLLVITLTSQLQVLTVAPPPKLPRALSVSEKCTLLQLRAALGLADAAVALSPLEQSLWLRLYGALDSYVVTQRYYQLYYSSVPFILHCTEL
jgi:hypothetical protein